VGGAGFTAIDTVVLAVAPPPDAVTVYVPAADAAAGVPEIVPFEGLRLRPAGRAGVTLTSSPA
jgi:hypothetical protein